MARLEDDGYCRKASCRPSQKHVDRNERCVILSERFAQLCTEKTERTDILGKVHSDGTSKREAGNAGRKSAHKPMPFFLRRAINDIKAVFQLVEQSRDLFGRLLEI